jgi:hypothetical protein
MEQGFKGQPTYRIDTEIYIEATAEQVWKVFGNFKSWPNWSDFAVFKTVPEVHKRCQVVFMTKGCMKSSSFNPKVRMHSRH